jgi:hypothetical protein
MRPRASGARPALTWAGVGGVGGAVEGFRRGRGGKSIRGEASFDVGRDGRSERGG